MRKCGIIRTFLRTSLRRVKKSQELSKGPDRIRLFFECFEHGVELGDLEQVLDSLGKAHQFELTPVVGYRGEPRDQLANSRAVNVGHLTEVEDDLLLALCRKVPDQVPKRARAFP